MAQRYLDAKPIEELVSEYKLTLLYTEKLKQLIEDRINNDKMHDV